MPKKIPLLEPVLDVCFSSKPTKNNIEAIEQAVTKDLIYPEEYRFLPLLYSRADKTHFSKETWTIAKSTYKHTYYRNRILIDRANKAQNKILSLMDGPVIALKGLALLTSVYKTLGERPMSDIDFLLPNIPLDDSEMIRHYCDEQAYFLHSLAPYGPTFKDKKGFEYDFHRALHLEASNPMLQKCLSEQSNKITLKEYDFTCLCEEHLFVHVIYHGILSPGVSHSRRWIVDAVVILREVNLDIKRLTQAINLLDLPYVISLGLDELKKVAIFNQAEKRFFNHVQAQIKQSSKVLRPFKIREPRADLPNQSLTRTRGQWLLLMINFYLLCPITWRKIMPMRTYYQKVFFMAFGKQSLLKIFYKKLMKSIPSLMRRC